jgi:uncharacterized protein YbcI
LAFNLLLDFSKEQNMNVKQQELILSFKKNYPNKTLKQVSELTGINLTRVFRIFNGNEMKISEFTIFNELVEKKTQKNFNSQIIQDLNKLILRLPENQLGRLSQNIKYELSMHQTILGE